MLEGTIYKVCLTNEDAIYHAHYYAINCMLCNDVGDTCNFPQTTVWMLKCTKQRYDFKNPKKICELTCCSKVDVVLCTKTCYVHHHLIICLCEHKCYAFMIFGTTHFGTGGGGKAGISMRSIFHKISNDITTGVIFFSFHNLLFSFFIT